METELIERRTKGNKTSSVESLAAVFLLLSAKTKAEFCYYYNIATHSNTGASAWFYMNQYKKCKDKKNADR